MKIYHILYHIYFHSASFFVNFRADFSLSIALHFDQISILLQFSEIKN